MELSTGTRTIGPRAGYLRLRTGRAGVGAKVGHDLTIEVTRWSGTTVIDPADTTASSVTAEIDTTSLEVLSGTGGIKELTDSDRADIAKTIVTKVLRPDLNPTMVFRSIAIEGIPQRFAVTGELTINGTTREIVVTGGIQPGGTLHATATIVQSEFGIKPYSAMLGALKVADEVGVEIELDLAGTAEHAERGAGER